MGCKQGVLGERTCTGVRTARLCATWSDARKVSCMSANANRDGHACVPWCGAPACAAGREPVPLSLTGSLFAVKLLKACSATCCECRALRTRAPTNAVAARPPACTASSSPPVEAAPARRHSATSSTPHRALRTGVAISDFLNAEDLLGVIVYCIWWSIVYGGLSKNSQHGRIMGDWNGTRGK